MSLLQLFGWEGHSHVLLLHLQHLPNLSIKLLRENIQTVPHVKPRGRPKHTGTIWPSKREGRKRPTQKSLSEQPQQQHHKLPPNRRPREQDSEKANVSPNKRTKTSLMYTVGTPAYQARIRRENRRAVWDPVPVDLTGDEVIPLSQDDTVLCISDVRLSQQDMGRLKPGQWLDTSLINAGQALLKALLKAKFPGVHTWLPGCATVKDLNHRPIVSSSGY